MEALAVFVTLAMMIFIISLMERTAPVRGDVITFPPTSKLVAYSAHVAVTYDQFNETTMLSLLQLAKNNPVLAKLRVEDTLRKCIPLNEELHFDAFDHVQISWNNIALLRVTNKDKNVGYSVDIDSSKADRL